MAIYQMGLKKNFKKTHVWSGPIFHPVSKAKYVNDTPILIPTHLYKVVMFEDAFSYYSFAVVISNNDDNKLYLISIEFLEQLTGLVFPRIVKDAQNQPPLACIGYEPSKWHLIE